MGSIHTVADAFRSVPELYERARPEYPPAAIEWLTTRLELGPGRVVLDVGAGTGKLTRPLVASGARVIAVEPLEEMRAVLARRVPGAELLAAAAEALPLPDASVDAVTAGQAFHWFDAPVAVGELARVLRPGGALALVWNMRDLRDPVQARIHGVLDSVRRDAPSAHEQAWRGAVAASPLLGELEERSFPWEAAYRRDELRERVASISFVAGLPRDERSALLERVLAAVDGEPEPFALRHRTDVFVLPRIGNPSGQAAGSHGTPPVSQPTRQ